VQNKINLEKITRGKIVNKLYISSILLRQNYEANMAKKRRKLLADYYALKKPVPLRLIAEILQTNITNVHRRIKKGSFKIQRYLGDFVLVKTSWRENEIPEWFSRYVA
jgi:flagellar motor switch protein FliG